MRRSMQQCNKKNCFCNTIFCWTVLATTSTNYATSRDVSINIITSIAERMTKGSRRRWLWSNRGTGCIPSGSLLTTQPSNKKKSRVRRIHWIFRQQHIQLQTVEVITAATLNSVVWYVNARRFVNITTSETLVTIHQMTRRHIPEDVNSYNGCNFKITKVPFSGCCKTTTLDFRWTAFINATPGQDRRQK
jgi:hypothetical protein